MTRVPLVAADSDDPAIAAVFARFATEGREPIALYRALANAPELLPAYAGLARAVRAGGDAALRELLILRIAVLTESDYEWSHHLPLARKAGIAAEKIDAIPSWQGSEHFDERERAAMACIDEVHDHALTDATFAELGRFFDVEESVWILSLGAFYELVARLIQGLGVPVEPAYEPFIRER